eukprot:maker-scaffold_8-snap-gene-2.16-mRNA-1 protein AED:0.07 eAED:0.89 QI:0/0/0.5/1/0/0/2/34/170
MSIEYTSSNNQPTANTYQYTETPQFNQYSNPSTNQEPVVVEGTPLPTSQPVFAQSFPVQGASSYASSPDPAVASNEHTKKSTADKVGDGLAVAGMAVGGSIIASEVMGCIFICCFFTMFFVFTFVIFKVVIDSTSDHDDFGSDFEDDFDNMQRMLRGLLMNKLTQNMFSS